MSGRVIHHHVDWGLISFWFAATVVLTTLIVCVTYYNTHEPPTPPTQTVGVRP